MSSTDFSPLPVDQVAQCAVPEGLGHAFSSQ